jgi:sensor c-di-GMP phosphodiesterase-like protein
MDQESQGVVVPPLTVYYQPVVDLQTGAVVGSEALMRFVRADGSLASPAEGGVIDRIESDPVAVVELMERLFECLARDAAPLFDRVPGFYVSVNVPPTVLGTGLIARILEESRMDRHRTRLVAEITERQALTDVGRAALSKGRAAGIRVAIDDFGTGQSGLGQLMGLEFDILKIDRSQVEPLLKSASAERLLRGVVALAGPLHVRLTAEGVETRSQAFFLRAAGVDYGQGWYWSKALPIDGFERVLREGFADSLRFE